MTIAAASRRNPLSASFGGRSQKGLPQAIQQNRARRKGGAKL